MSLTFYYSPRSSASRIQWTLAELGVPHEAVLVDLKAGEQKKPAFLALNPNGKVPTIVLDGTPMFEALAIQIALGERFGVEKGLWPAAGTPERLQALTWLAWGQISLATAMVRYMTSTSDWTPKEQHNAAQAEVAMKEIHSLLRILEDRLEGRDYVTGASFTLADLDLAAALQWGLHVARIDSAPYPRMQAWLARIHDRPVARAVLAAM